MALGIVLLPAPVAQRPLPSLDMVAAGLLGGNLAMNMAIALLVYSRAHAAGGAQALVLAGLFLSAGGGFALPVLEVAADAFGIDHTTGARAGNVVWLLWRGVWLTAVALFAWMQAPSGRAPRSGAAAETALAVLVAIHIAACLSYRQVVGPAAPRMWLADAMLPLQGLLTLVAGVGLLRRLAPVHAAGHWLAVILAGDLVGVAMCACGAGPQSLGFAAGAAALLAVRLLAFASLLRGMAEQVAVMREANTTLERLAHHDALTNLANRRRLDERLKLEWRRAARDRSNLALVLIDIDRFKQFNDCYGHPVGDACLVQIAGLLGAHARRPADLAARYGGEEFALLLPGTDLAAALGLAETIRVAVRHLAIPHAGSSSGIVTLSAGVACLLPHGHERHANRLLVAADQALYLAKQSGRDCASGTPITAGAALPQPWLHASSTMRPSL